VVETIAVTAANVTVSGSQLTINPAANLGQALIITWKLPTVRLQISLATIMLVLPEIALGISKLWHPRYNPTHSQQFQPR
jgi:hypothetical protein